MSINARHRGSSAFKAAQFRAGLACPVYLLAAGLYSGTDTERASTVVIETGAAQRALIFVTRSSGGKTNCAIEAYDLTVQHVVFDDVKGQFGVIFWRTQS